MPEKKKDNNKLIKRINDNESLTDILIQFEDFLDGLDMYAFRNWMEGEVIEGPDVKRHWITVGLRYDYKEMPDPKGGMRLLKHGCLVEYKKAVELRTIKDKKKSVQDIRGKEANDEENNQVNRKVGNTEANIMADHMQDVNMLTGKPKMKKHKIWIVEISVPRKFIDEIEAEDLEMFNNSEVDTNTVSDAVQDKIDGNEMFNQQGNQQNMGQPAGPAPGPGGSAAAAPPMSPPGGGAM